MTTTTLLLNTPDLIESDYVVLGLATCFIREDSDIHPVEIVEPIPSAALDALLKGITTSYKFAHATTLDVLMDGEKWRLPEVFPSNVQLCDDFHERLAAATRTYKRRSSQSFPIAVGTTYRNFNYSLERKRLLNSERIVKTEDNVKQHEYTHKTL